LSIDLKEGLVTKVERKVGSGIGERWDRKQSYNKSSINSQPEVESREPVK
jgi:hypothetical protein